MPVSRSCVKTGQGKVAMQDLELPDTPGAGQALVRTTMATVCGSDLHIVDEMPMGAGLPMGHEAVGIVEAVGSGVTRFKPGDRVAACCFASCGTCDQCMRGEHSVCETFRSPSNLLFGGQGEYFIVNGADTSMAKIPAGLDDDQVLFVTDILSTGFGAIERAGIKMGDSVAIFAQGPVGLCATIAARTLGAGLIIGVESIPERIEMAKRMGANEVVSPENAVAEIMALTGDKGVDIAVEALGKQVTFENACRSTRMGGTVSSVGVYSMFPTLTLPTDGSFMHRKLVTTLCPAGRQRLEDLMAIIESGIIDTRPMITHRMPIAETPAAYDLFRSKAEGVLKIALVP